MTETRIFTERLSAAAQQRLGVRGLSKYFGDFAANSDVTLSVDRGEIHALLGENGAGKSTLVKMIYGILTPDAGSMELDGAAYRPSKPSDARAHGVGMVFQHFAVFDALRVIDNIALGLDGRMPDAALADEVMAICDRYRLHIELGRHVADLGAGERQRLEIIRVLMQDPSLLILDEPTSVLTPQETEELFLTLDRLSDEGRSIIYISHKLDEVRALCDRATLLRGGQVVDVVDPRQESTRSLGEKMIGERLSETKRVHPTIHETEPRLSIRAGDIWPATEHAMILKEIYLSVHPGSILGIAGVSGNGQDALFDLLSGELPMPNPESMLLDGEVIGHLSIEARRHLGVLSAPEGRLGHAAVPELTLWENVILTARHTRGIMRNEHLISGRNAKSFAKEVMETFDVKASSVEAKASSLSGGNLQKFLIGREILGAPRLFIVSNPTWGVDAKAQQFIHQRLLELAATGCAVIVMSQDIDELLSITDRICAICHGQLSRTHDTEVMTPEHLGALMLGQEIIG